VTEELPWESPGGSAEPPPVPPDRAGPARGRLRTAVDGTLRLDPREPRADDPPEILLPRADRSVPEWSVPGWSPGEWSQEPRGESREDGSATTSRRQLREMGVAPAAEGPPAPLDPAPTGGASVDPAPAGLPAADAVPPAARADRPAPWSADTRPRWTDAAPAAEPAPGPFPSSRSAPPPPAGPSTGELEVYGLSRREVQRRSARRDTAIGNVVGTGSGPGDAVRAGVERWSRWAAGLGRPPRDASGTRRYPGREGLFPPAVWLTAALGVAVLAGLVAGIVVSGGSGSAAAVPAAVTTATVTVTNATTAPAVTTTTTRTRTKTLTVAPTPTDPAQGGGDANGGTLAPGSSGQEVVVLQQELAQLGLFLGGPTGTYDQRTQIGVQTFQARAGITADPPGVAGPTTRAAINQATGR
jgi:Putative peptidoglycan binding domain